MKSTGTIENGDGLWSWPNVGATNESGFTALPAGQIVGGTGQGQGIGYATNFWTSDARTFLNRHTNNLYVYSSGGEPEYGYSIRCIETVIGCADPYATNFNEMATLNDGSCVYPQGNFDCENNCISHLDCSGRCGGSAIIDECLVCCSGDTGILCNTNENCPECPSNEILGCDGVWGSSSFLDNCNIYSSQRQKLVLLYKLFNTSLVVE